MTTPEDMTVTGPCGHAVPFLNSCKGIDDFVCPVCKMWWGVDQAPATILPSGFAMPGKRTVVIRGTHLDRVQIQAASSRTLIHRCN
jgi:hypothetical protein